MLAQVAYEIHRIAHMLGGKGKMPNMEDFLLKFGGDSKDRPVEIDPELADDFEAGFGLPGIELDEKPDLDAKWQSVNDQSKAEWTAFLQASGVEVQTSWG